MADRVRLLREDLAGDRQRQPFERARFQERALIGWPLWFCANAAKALSSTLESNPHSGERIFFTSQQGQDAAKFANGVCGRRSF
jgi:hypothetical protein